MLEDELLEFELRRVEVGPDDVQYLGVDRAQQIRGCEFGLQLGVTWVALHDRFEQVTVRSGLPVRRFRMRSRSARGPQQNTDSPISSPFQYFAFLS